MPTPEFFYFDLGNVLLKFDHQLAARQMGEVAGLDAQRVWDVVFDSGLELRYEAGEVDDAAFYEEFCKLTDTRSDRDALLLAGSAIFTPNYSILPIVAGLQLANCRLGILSNTCTAHWRYCIDGRYPILNTAFNVYALSYELGAVKPSPKIFAGAAKLAGVAPEKIFFVDDIAGHVAGARAAGYDAVQYASAPALAAALRQRGLEFNY